LHKKLYIQAMKVTSYSKLRQNLARCMDEVNEDHAPMLVTRANGKHAVLMSLEDFASYEETRYLMSNPANAKALTEAIADIEAGHNMIDVEFDEATGEFRPIKPDAPAKSAA
jgi:antitoxin YefM